MPCIGQTSDNQVTDLNNTIRLREAMLCGLMTALEANEALETYVNSIDYREGGFTRRQLMSWWSRHKEADRARRAQAAGYLATSSQGEFRCPAETSRTTTKWSA